MAAALVSGYGKDKAQRERRVLTNNPLAMRVAWLGGTTRYQQHAAPGGGLTGSIQLRAVFIEAQRNLWSTFTHEKLE